MRRFRSAVMFAVLSAITVAGSHHASAQEDLKLLPTDGAAGDYFGFSVALSGTTAIVGAYVDDDNGTNSGSAYLFDTTTGDQIAKLLPNDGAVDDWFGYSVAISGTNAIVGARWDDDNGTGSGSAYLFDTTTGVQTFKLLPTDGAAGDEFGVSVAISGATAIVGAFVDDDNGTDSGSAYLFDTMTGQQIAKLLPTDGAADDVFGNSVAISGTTAIVGAYGDDDNRTDSGSAYLFDTTTGQQIAKLLPTDGAAGDVFGNSVAISGTTAIVGARGDDDNGTNSGSAYLFDTTTGDQTAKLLPTDGAAGDYFGYSVAISGTTAIVGARLDDDNGTGSGSAYLFDTTTGEQIAKLLPTDGATGDNFGFSVALSGDTAIVGAYQDDDNGTNSGSAYVFECAGGSELDPPDAYPPGPGLGTVFLRIERVNDELNAKWLPFEEGIDWTRPTVVLIHGWRDNGVGKFVQAFVDIAFDEENGVLWDLPDAQIVSIDWRERALQTDPESHYAWQSARNGAADGQYVGLKLARIAKWGEFETDRLHIVAHSNGSAFAALLAKTLWVETDGQTQIKQLTILDAPSENTLFDFGLYAPPTGWLVYQNIDGVGTLENWSVHDGAGHLEFGDLMGQYSSVNMAADANVTAWVAAPWLPLNMHGAIPIRYAISADKRFQEPGYPLLYKEPGAFAKTSVVLGKTPLDRGVAYEWYWKGIYRGWRTRDVMHWPGMEESGMAFTSPISSWKGLNAFATGTEDNPAFQVEGAGDEYVEFTVDPGMGNETNLSRLTFDIEYLSDIDQPVYMYAWEEGAEEWQKYVGTLQLSGGVGEVDSELFALLTDATGPVTVGFWMDAHGDDVRGFEIRNFELWHSEFVIMK